MCITRLRFCERVVNRWLFTRDLLVGAYVFTYRVAGNGNYSRELEGTEDL